MENDTPNINEEPDETNLPNDIGDTGEAAETGETGETEPTGEAGAPGERSKIKAYKGICAKLGIIMTVYFVCRILGGLISSWTSGLTGAMSGAAAYAVSVLISVVTVYAIPIIVTVIVFKSISYYRENGGLRTLYKRPRRLARALGTFPAMIGLGYGIVLITLLVSYLITRYTAGQTFVQDLLRPNAIEAPSDVASVLMMVFLLVVIAPVFEEFLVRGIMYDALKPYGCGMAIIISSVLFGLMHGSLDKLFYTTALGLALGYVRYATGSLFVVTILHALVNSVAAVLLFLFSMAEITEYAYRLLNTMLYIYVLAFLVLTIVGIVVFIRKIPVIRKYKIENEWKEIGAGKKTALFFVSIPVIIMLVFAINEHMYGWLLYLIIR